MGVHSEAKEKWDGYGMPQPVVTSEELTRATGSVNFITIIILCYYCSTQAILNDLPKPGACWSSKSQKACEELILTVGILQRT